MFPNQWRDAIARVWCRQYEPEGLCQLKTRRTTSRQTRQFQHEDLRSSSVGFQIVSTILATEPRTLVATPYLKGSTSFLHFLVLHQRNKTALISFVFQKSPNRSPHTTTWRRLLMAAVPREALRHPN